MPAPLAARAPGLRPRAPAAGAALSRGRRAAQRHRRGDPGAGGRPPQRGEIAARSWASATSTDVTADVTEYLSHLAERELIRDDERPTTLLAELTHRCPLHCPYCSNPLDLLRAESEIGDRGLEAGLHRGPRAGRAAARPVRAASRWCGRTSRSSPCMRAAWASTPPWSPRVWASPAGARRHCATPGWSTFRSRCRTSDPMTAEQIAGRELGQAEAGGHRAGEGAGLRVLDQRRAAPRQSRPHRARSSTSPRATARIASSSPTRSTTAGGSRTARGSCRRREQVLAAKAIAQDRMQRYKGRMQIPFVLPDYFEELPKACYGGWGRYYIVVSPDGKALPCHGATPSRRSTFAERPGPFASTWIWHESRGVPGVSRGRLDEGALPELSAEGRRLRRLPLPGVRAHRGRGQCRPGLHALSPHRHLIDEALHEHAGADDVRLPRLRRRAPAARERQRAGNRHRKGSGATTAASAPSTR